MSTAATMQQTPAVPPRPTRGSDNAAAPSMPKVPPRPSSKRNDRSVSPNPARFAPSPFTEGIISKPLRNSPHYSHNQQSDDPIERAGSVGMPSVGEEGLEYDNVAGELQAEQFAKRRSLSPEQTRTIGEDIKLHAPKPSLPALSAKQRVQAVTRTDSDKAAQYGLGRPRSRPGSFHEDRVERTSSRQGIKKKPSSSFSTHSDTGNGTDDEHGIPQFGHRVPMNPHLGDVQAPSPAPGNDSPGRHHHRKGSSRSLPPGSYGLHGHGPAPLDKLEKAYYQKHPELLEKEHHHKVHERQNDFAMSSSDLNKLVRETRDRGSGETTEYRSTPTDEVAFLASEEYASRISSPRPASAAPKDNSTTSPLKQSFQPNPLTPYEEDKPIHVDDAKHPEYRSYGEEDTAIDDDEHEYTAPILAADEVQKDPNAYLQRPAVHPVSERRGSSFEMEDPPSRPTSRPTSLYNTISHEYHNSTPLEDVEEYEPLFTEEEAKAKEQEIQQKKAEARYRQRHFPSKDIWEDAPSSVHFTAEVSTPEVPEPKRRKSSAFDAERPQTPAHVFAQQQEQIAEQEAATHKRPEDWNIRDEEKAHRAETRSPLKQRTSSHGRVSSPAHAFAQRQEELAEKEANAGIRPEDWSSRDGASWRESRPHLATQRTGGSGKFPSRDVWEDTPESAMHVTTISGSPPKPDIPTRPSKKLSGSSTDRPAVPERPKPRQGSGDDAGRPRPPVSDKPKPQVPTRPSKSTSGDNADVAAKPKPPVPNRPVGGKIAALQAGFMSDLNKRLKIGPQIPVKKEEQEEEAAAAAAETEKAPLSDARKSRARGPQRRAPAKSPAPPAEGPKQAVPTFTFTMAESSWSIDPEEGSVSVSNPSEEKPAEESEPVEETPAVEEKVPEPEAEQIPVTSEPQEIEAQPEPAEPEQAAEQDTTQEAPVKQEPTEETTSGSSAEAAAPPTETKTLVANTAGESVLETEVEKKQGGNDVEPVSVEDTPKDL